MNRAQLFESAAGYSLLALGFVASALGFSDWLFHLTSATAQPFTIADALFHTSIVPPHFRVALMQSMWWRVLNTEAYLWLLWPGFLSACGGAALLFHAERRRLAEEGELHASTADGAERRPEGFHGHRHRRFEE